MAENPHEHRDWSFRVVAGFAVGVLIFLGVVALLIAGLFSFLATHDAKSSELPSMTTPQFPPTPQLQAIPGDQLKNLHATEQAILNSYGWVDRQNNIVHIPISKAIDLMAVTPTPTDVELRVVP